ncbi:MAG: hypothetical protein RLZZ562_2960 [Planctomycetota bacterium]|jgi:YHS domain-containing protein
MHSTILTALVALATISLAPATPIRAQADAPSAKEPNAKPAQDPAAKPKADATPADKQSPSDDAKGASEALRKKSWLLGDAGLALQGYDPLSYFDAKGPQKGDAKHAVTFRGVTYHFVSEDNRKKFEAEPLKWEPPYGGWCAFAVIDGDKVEIDPTNYEVIDGRVYLFYKGFWGDAKSKWDKLVKGETAQKIVAKADAGWQKLEAADQKAVDAETKKQKPAK